MAKLLDQTIALIRTHTPETQNDFACVLLNFADDEDERAVYYLTLA